MPLSLIYFNKSRRFYLGRMWAVYRRKRSVLSVIPIDSQIRFKKIIFTKKYHFHKWTAWLIFALWRTRFIQNWQMRAKLKKRSAELRFKNRRFSIIFGVVFIKIFHKFFHDLSNLSIIYIEQIFKKNLLSNSHFSQSFFNHIDLPLLHSNQTKTKFQCTPYRGHCDWKQSEKKCKNKILLHTENNNTTREFTFCLSDLSVCGDPLLSRLLLIYSFDKTYNSRSKNNNKYK